MLAALYIPSAPKDGFSPVPPFSPLSRLLVNAVAQETSVKEVLVRASSAQDRWDGEQGEAVATPDVEPIPRASGRLAWCQGRGLRLALVPRYREEHEESPPFAAT